MQFKSQVLGFFLVLLSYNLWLVWEWFESNGLCYQDDNSQEPKSSRRNYKQSLKHQSFFIIYFFGTIHKAKRPSRKHQTSRWLRYVSIYKAKRPSRSNNANVKTSFVTFHNVNEYLTGQYVGTEGVIRSLTSTFYVTRLWKEEGQRFGHILPLKR